MMNDENPFLNEYGTICFPDVEEWYRTWRDLYDESVDKSGRGEYNTVMTPIEAAAKEMYDTTRIHDQTAPWEHARHTVRDNWLHVAEVGVTAYLAARVEQDTYLQSLPNYQKEGNEHGSSNL